MSDPRSHLGVSSLPSLESNSDTNEMTGAIEAQVRSEDFINADDPAVPLAVWGGVTSVQILPGRGNNIGGWATIIKLNGGQWLEQFKATSGKRFRLEGYSRPNRPKLSLRT